MKVNMDIMQKKHLDKIAQLKVGEKLIGLPLENNEELSCDVCFFRDTCHFSDAKEFPSICNGNDIVYLVDKK